jgi:type III secretory pathway component EscU
MTDIWKHGKYVDLWSLVHFLSGVLLAAVTQRLDLPFFWALAVSVVALVAWEWFEALKKIIEPSVNVTVDIVIGLVGFLLAWSFVSWNDALLVAVLIATVLLSFWGFMDFLKRGYR